MHTSKQAPPFLGCIADDFTGASDLASFLVASGMRTLQINGLPNESLLVELNQYDAIVIALKSRTAPIKEAVGDSLLALKWLEKSGCQKFFFKYCSTFDSTPQGNIGPVTDALLEALNQKSTIICPALPVNGRTVYRGHLFVFDQLLNESPLKDHPLTPMKDANLLRLIEQQGQGKAINIAVEDIEKGVAHLTQVLQEASVSHRYLVTDTLNHEHLTTIGHSVQSFKLITGGSGLATDLSVEFIHDGFTKTDASTAIDKIDSPIVILSGSCSAMTQKQVAHYSLSHPSLYIDALALDNGSQTIESILKWVQQNKDQHPLIYTTVNAEKVRIIHQKLGKTQAQTLLETFTASLASKLVELGLHNIIVAGGETSGAVVSALGLQALKIGPSIAPGVPMVQTIMGTKINLALKSGNFGDESFFSTAAETFK